MIADLQRGLAEYHIALAIASARRVVRDMLRRANLLGPLGLDLDDAALRLRTTDVAARSLAPPRP